MADADPAATESASHDNGTDHPMSATDRTEPVDEPAKLAPPLPIPELASAYLRTVALAFGTVPVQ